MSTTATPAVSSTKTIGAPPALGPVAAALSTGFTKIAANGKPELLKVKNVLVFKKLQTRTDCDSGSVVDEGRAEMFADAMNKGAKFPAIKVMRVKDSPGNKDKEVDVAWDGMHTLRGKEIAKIAEVDAEVWVGTWAQAQFLAAVRANREHDNNGKPLSTKDKIHAVSIYAAAWKDSGIPKKDWPSNRDAADTCGCSRQLVNDMDPFERGKGNVRETKAANKRAQRATAAAANGHADPSKGAKAPPHFEIVEKTTGQKVASYDANSEAEATEAHKRHHQDADMGKYVARKLVEPPKSGTETVIGFDWTGMESYFGYLSRGLDGIGDLYNLKGTQEHKEMTAALNTFAGHFNNLRKKHSKKTPANAATT